MTEQLYFDDPLCLEFHAEVTEVLRSHDGRFSALLPRTYFYPTSGGQDHDIGKIGDANVMDVYKGPDNNIIHVLDREIDPGIYPASIDKGRRLQNMQAHTAQHILSRAFEMELNLETVSANINSENPSTIDLDANSVQESDLERVEDKANSIIFENRIIKSYTITDKEIQRIPFRRPPKVTGKIRVVEVDGFDYSACGGTHCPQTGMVGLIKIIKFETQNHKIRIHFVAGKQALNVFQKVFRSAKSITNVMETNLDDMELSFQRLVENLQQSQFELETYKNRFSEIEMGHLRESAFQIGNMSLIMKLYPGRSTEELRKMVNRIRSENGFIVILAGQKRQKISMVVGCSQDIHLDARKILNLHLEKFNGRGGGDPKLAQGGCNLPDEYAGDIFLKSKEIVQYINQVDLAD